MAITTINQDNFEEKVTNAASPVFAGFLGCVVWTLHHALPLW